jgi:aminopeptidase N
MRRIFLCASLLMLAFSGVRAQSGDAGAAGIGDPYFPELGNGGYDAQHYTIDLDWDAKTNRIDATVTMQAQATQDLSQFDLDFEGFTITKLTVDDATATYKRQDNELVITPAQPLAKGDAFTTRITYGGVPGDGLGSAYDRFAVGWNRYDKGVFVASEPDGASRWYPVNNHPLDKATYTLDITVPTPYVVAANGTLKDVQKGSGTTTYVWDSRDPIASYLVTVNIGDLVEQTAQGPNGLPIRHYFPSELAEDAKAAFAKTPDMIAYFNQIFGPYPFEAYGAVVADTNISFALETQTLSLFGKQVAVRNNSPEIVTSHELSHQWFGDSVSLKRWKDIWLNEGFATYASALWVEHQYGRARLDAMMTDYYNALTSRELAFMRFVPPGNPPADDLFNQGVYIRGGWTLHALRLSVGDDAFFKILHTYYDRYKYNNAGTEDFIQVAQEVSGKDLTALFDTWLYAKDVPDVPEMGLKNQQPAEATSTEQAS